MTVLSHIERTNALSLNQLSVGTQFVVFNDNYTELEALEIWLADNTFEVVELKSSSLKLKRLSNGSSIEMSFNLVGFDIDSNYVWAVLPEHARAIVAELRKQDTN